jgi:hypothetical protein
MINRFVSQQKYRKIEKCHHDIEAQLSLSPPKLDAEQFRPQHFFEIFFGNISCETLERSGASRKL